MMFRYFKKSGDPQIGQYEFESYLCEIVGIPEGAEHSKKKERNHSTGKCYSMSYRARCVCVCVCYRRKHRRPWRTADKIARGMKHLMNIMVADYQSPMINEHFTNGQVINQPDT